MRLPSTESNLTFLPNNYSKLLEIATYNQIFGAENVYYRRGCLYTSIITNETLFVFIPGNYVNIDSIFLKVQLI